MTRGLKEVSKLRYQFLQLTEAGTGKKIRLRADLFGGIIENTRGTVDVWTEFVEDGSSKVFTVSEDADQIIIGLAEAVRLSEEKKK